MSKTSKKVISPQVNHKLEAARLSFIVGAAIILATIASLLFAGLHSINWTITTALSLGGFAIGSTLMFRASRAQGVGSDKDATRVLDIVKLALELLLSGRNNRRPMRSDEGDEAEPANPIDVPQPTLPKNVTPLGRRDGDLAKSTRPSLPRDEEEPNG